MSLMAALFVFVKFNSGVCGFAKGRSNVDRQFGEVFFVRSCNRFAVLYDRQL